MAPVAPRRARAAHTRLDRGVPSSGRARLRDAAQSSARAGGRVAALDGLRGVAALSVLVYHVWLYTTVDSGHPRTWHDHVLRQGYLGLVLFFVLSGYLLYSPWLRASLERHRAPALGRYVRSRFARIAPGYYVAVAGASVLMLTANHAPGTKLIDFSQLPLFLVFAQNWSPHTLLRLDPPMWTLAIEASFYVALPLIGFTAIRFARTRRHQLALIAGLIAVGVVTRGVTAGHAARDPLLWSLPAYIDYFACGMLAAAGVHRRTIGSPASWALIGLGAALVAANATWHAALKDTVTLQAFQDLPAALGFAALISVAAASRERRRFLASRPLEGLGRISYGLYLWHLPVIVWMRGHGLFPNDLVLALAAVLPPALVVAAASWSLVERPALERARGQNGQRRRLEAAPHAARDDRRPLAQAA
ncbi:MAG: acyltransferase family protein [Thermoleophilaceae bacterium]